MTAGDKDGASLFPLALLSLIICVDAASYGVIVPVMPHFVKKMDLTAFDVSSLYIVYGCVMLALPIPFGALADRVGRLPFIYLGMACKALALVGIVAADGYWGLLAARVIDAAGGIATWTVAMALVADYYPREVLGSRFGTLMAAGEVGTLIGPLLSGPLVDLTDKIYPPFFIMAGLCVLCGVLASTLPRAEWTRAGGSPLGELSRLFTSRRIVAASIVYVAGASFIGMIEPILPLYLDEKLRFSPTWISALLVAVGGSVAICMPAAGWLSQKVETRKLIALGLVVSAFTMPGFVLIMDRYILVCWMVLVGAGWALVFAPVLPLFTDAVRDKDGQYGVAFGLTNALWASGFIIGPSLGGGLAQYAGYAVSFIAFSAILLALSPIVWSMARPRSKAPEND